MQKKKSLSIDSNLDDDYAQVLFSLKSQILSKKQTTTETPQQQKKLNKIFVKTKKQRMRDIFIEKIKRNQVTNPPCSVKSQSPFRGLFGVKLKAIEFPQKIVNIILLTNTIIILVLLVLSTFQGFIENFHDEVALEVLIPIKSICLIINILNFIVRCANKSYVNGQNIKYINQVIIAYAKSGRLFLDLLTIILQIMTIVYNKQKAISGVFFFLLIIVLIFTLNDLLQIEAAFLNSKWTALIWGLIKICISNIIVAHCMAGFILAMSQIDLQNNWMTLLQINDAAWHVRYFYAFYWGTTIMMTVGFGDVLPNSQKQVIITTFLEMFSCILLGYNISEIGHLIGQIRQKNDILNKKLAVFDRMVKSKNGKISVKLQNSIYNHIRQVHSGVGNLQYQMRGQLLDELPEHLRRAYYKQSNQQIFPTVLFFNRLKPSTVECLADKFQSRLYYEKEYLLVDEEQKIMILELGQVGFGYKRKGSSLKGSIFDSIKVINNPRFEEGASFQKRKKIKKQKLKPQFSNSQADLNQTSNQNTSRNITSPIVQGPSLLTTSFLSLFQQPNYDLIAKTHSLIWSISEEDFMEVISKSSIDCQYYFSVLHKHSFSENQWCSVYCPRCSAFPIRSHHVVYNCPKIVYMPFKNHIALKSVAISSPDVNSRQDKKRGKKLEAKKSALYHKRFFENMQDKKNKIKKVLLNFDLEEKENEEVQNVRQQPVIHSKNQNFDPMQLMSLIEETMQKNMEKIMEKMMRKYDTGYQDIFWNIESDELHNYQFYFPNQNPNRLYNVPIEQINKTKNIEMDRKSYHKGPIITSISNIGLQDPIKML